MTATKNKVPHAYDFEALLFARMFVADLTDGKSPSFPIDPGAVRALTLWGQVTGKGRDMRFTETGRVAAERQFSR